MNINSFQQLIAHLLFICLCLQSCGGGFDNNPLIPTQEEQIALIQTNAQACIQPLVDQTLIAQGGHSVTFYKQAGQLKANVVMNVPQGFSKTYAGLSVAIEQGAELSTLPQSSEKVQQHQVHLQPAQKGSPAKIVIYKGAGLMGGGKDKKHKNQALPGEEEEEEANQNKKRSQKGKENACKELDYIFLERNLEDRLKKVKEILKVNEDISGRPDDYELQLTQGIISNLEYLRDLLDRSRYAFDTQSIRIAQNALIVQLYNLASFPLEQSLKFLEIVKTVLKQELPDQNWDLKTKNLSKAYIGLTDRTKKSLDNLTNYIVNSFFFKDRVEARIITGKVIDTIKELYIGQAKIREDQYDSWMDLFLNGYLSGNPEICINEKEETTNTLLNPGWYDRARVLDELEKKIIEVKKEANSNSYKKQIDDLYRKYIGANTPLVGEHKDHLCLVSITERSASENDYVFLLGQKILEKEITPTSINEDLANVNRCLNYIERKSTYYKIEQLLRFILSPIENPSHEPKQRLQELYTMGATIVFGQIPKKYMQKQNSIEGLSRLEKLYWEIPFKDLRNIGLIVHHSKRLERPQDKKVLRDVLPELNREFANIIPLLKELIKEEIANTLGVNVKRNQVSLKSSPLNNINKLSEYGIDVPTLYKFNEASIYETLSTAISTPLINWDDKLRGACIRIFEILGEGGKNLSRGIKEVISSKKSWDSLSNLRSGTLHYLIDKAEYLLKQEKHETAIKEAKIIIKRSKKYFETFTLDGGTTLEPLNDTFGQHLEVLYNLIEETRVPREAKKKDEKNTQPFFASHVEAADNFFVSITLGRADSSLNQRLERLRNFVDYFNSDFDHIEEDIHNLPVSNTKKKEGEISEKGYLNGLLEKRKALKDKIELARQELSDIPAGIFEQIFSFGREIDKKEEDSRRQLLQNNLPAASERDTILEYEEDSEGDNFFMGNNFDEDIHQAEQTFNEFLKIYQKEREYTNAAKLILNNFNNEERLAQFSNKLLKKSHSRIYDQVLNFQKSKIKEEGQNPENLLNELNDFLETFLKSVEPNSEKGIKNIIKEAVKSYENARLNKPTVGSIYKGLDELLKNIQKETLKSENSVVQKLKAASIEKNYDNAKILEKEALKLLTRKLFRFGITNLDDVQLWLKEIKHYHRLILSPQANLLKTFKQARITVKNLISELTFLDVLTREKRLCVENYYNDFLRDSTLNLASEHYLVIMRRHVRVLEEICKTFKAYNPYFFDLIDTQLRSIRITGNSIGHLVETVGFNTLTPTGQRFMILKFLQTTLDYDTNKKDIPLIIDLKTLQPILNSLIENYEIPSEMILKDNLGKEYKVQPIVQNNVIYGLPLQGIVQQLLNHPDQEMVKNAVIGDIKGALLANMLPPEMRVWEASDLRAKFYTIKGNIEELSKKVVTKNQYKKLKKSKDHRDQTKAANWDKTKNKKSLLQAYKRSLKEQELIEHKIKEYAHKNYKTFIKSFYLTESAINNNLVFLELLSNINKFNICRWKLNKENILEPIGEHKKNLENPLHILQLENCVKVLNLC
jgi:hypothetical protein